MHTAHDKPWVVRADGDEAEVEGPAQVADLLKRRTAREMGVVGPVVVGVFGQLWHGAVAGVAAEPDGLAARGDSPGCPECGITVEGGTGGSVLAREAGDSGCDFGAGWRARGAWGSMG
jgi:hypothetical protein